MSNHRATILCVDDEAIPLMLRKSVLQKAGYNVFAANSGTEALEILARQSVDLVLTDLLMPGINGTELAREVKKRIPELPVVLYSGVNEIPEDATVTDMFISKVEGPVAMCEKIGEVLKRRGKAIV